MIEISKRLLNSPSKFRKVLQGYLERLRNLIQKNYSLEFNEEEIGDLLLSACRTNDFNVTQQHNNKIGIDEERVLNWINAKLLPNTVSINLDDEDIVRLLIFCFQITYQMFGGGTRATVTQKGFRQRRRTFESILVDQFVGKLGEIFVKKHLERSFPVNIQLDWEISANIERYRNDIINANRNVSIKSTPTLTGAWAEADIGYDYGIMVKCSVPQQPILQFFIEVCGFSKLLDFAEEKIPSSNGLFQGYLAEIRKRVRKYKCGEIQTSLKGFICGYFKTSEYTSIKENTKLPYLGTVREERYLVPINQLKWTKTDWENFLREVNLL